VVANMNCDDWINGGNVLLAGDHNYKLNGKKSRAVKEFGPPPLIWFSKDHGSSGLVTKNVKKVLP